VKSISRLVKSVGFRKGLASLLVLATLLTGVWSFEARAKDGATRLSGSTPDVSVQSARPPVSGNAVSAPAATATFTGDIRAKDRVVITSKATMRVRRIVGDVGDVVKKGDLLVELDHDLLDAQVKQGEAALALADAQLAKLRSGSRVEQIAIAQAGVASAQAELDLIMAGARKEQIAAAQSGLKAARAQLDMALAGPTSEQLGIVELQARIAEAQDALRAKTQDASSSINARGIAPYSPDMAWFQEIVSGLQVQLAQAQLKAVKAPTRTELIEQLQAAVEAAKAQVDLLMLPPRAETVGKQQAAVEIARQQLELVKNPITDNDLAAAVAGVVQAQAAFQMIKANRDDAILMAPFDGTIATKSFGTGALVMAGDPIVTLISMDTEAVFTVGETEFGQVKNGQSLSLTVPAYPGETFKGTVRAVSPQADPATRRFNVYVSISDPDRRLRPGMFVTVTL